MVALIESLNPFIKIFRLVGLFPVTFDHMYQPVEAVQTKIYSVLSISTFFFIFVYGFFEPDSYYVQNEAHNNIARTVDFIQLIGIRFTHFITLIESLLQRNALMQLLCKLNKWDEIIQDELKIVINHENLRKQTVNRLVTSVGFYFGIQLILLCIIIVLKDFAFIYYWIYYLVPFIVCCSRYVQIYIVVSLIKNRFEILNDAMSKVIFINTNNTTQQLNEQKNSSKTSKINGIEKINLIRDLYHRLWEISSLTNQSFGLSLLANIGNDFVAITGHCYWIFLTIQHFPGGLDDTLAVIGSMIWTIPALTNAFLIASICHTTVETVSKFISSIL